VRFGFKRLLLAVLLGGFGCTLLAGPQPPAGTVSQPSAPTVPVTEVLQNEEAAIQQPLISNAAAESQRQTDLNAKPFNPAHAVMLTVAALLFWPLLAPRLGRFLVRSDPWTETRPSAQERVAEQNAFTDFVAAFKVGPSAAPVAIARGPVSPPAVHTWELSAEVTASDGAGALKVEQATRAPAPVPVTPVSDENQKAARRRVSFAAAASDELSRLSLLLSGIAASLDTDGRRELLTKMCRQLGVFKNLADSPDVLPAWQMAMALEGLMTQLAGRPGRATPSSLHTAAAGVDLLKDLCQPGVNRGLTNNPPPRFLVVDDDTVCRHAVATALKKIFTEPELALDGATALALAEHEKFDVIFLDIEMPGMDGFELCGKIRATAKNQKTPIVFVTNHSDFDSRLKSTLSGAQDLIAKPFLSFEIALKALTLLLRGRLDGEKPQPAVQPALVSPRTPQPEPGPVPAPSHRI
jgi:CheY-like chemotaxis protein